MDMKNLGGGLRRLVSIVDAQGRRKPHLISIVLFVLAYQRGWRESLPERRA